MFFSDVSYNYFFQSAIFALDDLHSVKNVCVCVRVRARVGELFILFL